ncbi:MAG: hypothetical protein FP820_06395 [Sulfurimonas sp.]|nr:hypothetical protein [Sulfurimonas sp.]MBU3939904.1 hypothetical protein [bacterium]MBU4025834.1 hypothetical protein [bacterium]MBU4057893.1 hypothetical protein [bacterium]MBU4109561.1 hypothetical protein [bacterium]
MTPALKFFLLSFFIFYTSLNAQTPKITGVEEALGKPLIERYVIDELKDLRIENMKLRNELEKRIANSNSKCNT